MKVHGRRLPSGATLAELMVGLVIAMLLGAVVVRGILTEARVSEDREAWASARRVAAAAAGLLTAELRMVETRGGVEYANDAGDTLVVRVPYAFGVLCATNGTVSTVALLPADSVMLAAPGFSGFAWRDDASGAYTYVTSGTNLHLDGAAGACAPNGINPVTGLVGSPDGRVVDVQGSVPPGLAPGTVVFLFRRVRYTFEPSELVPGAVGLWRTLLATGTREELAAPFDEAARFAYYVVGRTGPQEEAPSPLSAIRGIEVRLDGRSETTSRFAGGSPRVVRLPVAIHFQNISD